MIGLTQWWMAKTELIFQLKLTLSRISNGGAGYLEAFSVMVTGYAS